MLKARVMTTMLYKDYGLVKGKGFDSWRRTGSLMQTVKVYNMREVDELVFADIAATAGVREPDYAVGGGVRTLEQVGKLLAVGAGEILLTSIERNGNFAGYDLEVTSAVSDAVNIPGIASGGCGSYEHMAAARKDGKASAVAAASIFHFTEQTPLQAKKYLHERGFAVCL